jgi:hypothetical protein
MLLGLCPKDVDLATFPELWGITERGTILSLGYDEEDRQIWSWNARLTVEPPTNAFTHREPA